MNFHNGFFVSPSQQPRFKFSTNLVNLLLRFIKLRNERREPSVAGYRGESDLQESWTYEKLCGVYPLKKKISHEFSPSDYFDFVTFAGWKRAVQIRINMNKVESQRQTKP